MKIRAIATMVAILASASVAQAQAKFPPDADNAALRYWFALAEVQEPPQDDATRHLMEATLVGQAAWDESKLGPILDSNSDALRALQEATKLPECNWGFDYRHGARMPIWFGMRARLLSRLNQLEGVREMARGDAARAMNTWLAGIHFAQDVARGGPVIVALIANAIFLDNLQPLRNNAQLGKFGESQKKELQAVANVMPEDGFDWGAAWGVEFAIGDKALQEPSMTGKPESDERIRAYDEYMLAAQSALRDPPNKASSRLGNLESEERSLGDVERRVIPSLRTVMEARIRLAAEHHDLIQALAQKQSSAAR